MSEKDKTVWETVKQVETVAVLPRTLEIVGKRMPIREASCTMFEIYGKDPADRKVWVATFFDENEATVWIQCSRTFGRPIFGAVMAGQEVKIEKGGEMSQTAAEAPVPEGGKLN